MHQPLLRVRPPLNCAAIVDFYLYQSAKLECLQQNHREPRSYTTASTLIGSNQLTTGQSLAVTGSRPNER